MTRILVVDDEPQIRRALAVNLRARAYDVDLAESGEEALRLAAAHHPDLILLDLGLPGIDGIDVVRGIHGWSSVPIVILSVREAEADKVAALDAGADDYVTKPFGMDELLARLRASLRRNQPAPETAVVTTEHFTIDLQDKRALINGEDVRLTPIEWGLVSTLARSPGRLVTQRHLLQQVWGPRSAQARARALTAAVLHHGSGDGVPVPGSGSGLSEHARRAGACVIQSCDDRCAPRDLRWPSSVAAPDRSTRRRRPDPIAEETHVLVRRPTARPADHRVPPRAPGGMAPLGEDVAQAHPALHPRNQGPAIGARHSCRRRPDRRGERARRTAGTRSFAWSTSRGRSTSLANSGSCGSRSPTKRPNQSRMSVSIAMSCWCSARKAKVCGVLRVRNAISPCACQHGPRCQA